VRAAVDVVVHLARTAEGARTIRWIDGCDARGDLRPLDRELLDRLVDARCPSFAG